ncbi:hypothetical protein E2P81_ATG01409 [Venturia nashicola]|nr:hypothetical protein E2P81_ATG01409 [Venturia nashicola]
MAPSSHTLGLHNYSFDSTSSTSPAGCTYPHYSQKVTATELARLAEQFGQQTVDATNTWVSQQQSRSTNENAASSNHAFSECAMKVPFSHAHQLSSLLEQMIASREQCSACVAEQAMVAETPVESWEEDETMGEMEEVDGGLDRRIFTYRRSADLSTEKGYVNKTIRVRKRRRGEGSG